MQAVVLAGGLGTRLKECVSDRPKVLSDINGKPFLSFVLDWLYRNGVCKVVLSVGYMADSIIRTYGNRYEGMILDYAIEAEPLGTGGGIQNALSHCSEHDIIVVNGDTVFDVELMDMMQTHQRSGCPLTLAVKKMFRFDRYGSVKIQNHRIIGFCEKAYCEQGYINGGVYIMNRELLQNIDPVPFSFEHRILEDESIVKYAFESDGYFMDIGIPSDYEKAKAELCHSLSGRKRKALFLDRDGTLNVDKGHVYRQEDLEFIKGMPEMIRQYKNYGYLVIVITNQAGIAKGYYSAEAVQKLHKFIDQQLIQRYDTCVDAFFYCPHHPQGVVKELSVCCGCRKPQPGLIHEAVFHYMNKGIQIDIPNSILIGDKPSDIQAGKAAGIKNCILTS